MKKASIKVEQKKWRGYKIIIKKKKDNKTAETEKVEQRKSSKLFKKNYENVRTNISRLKEPNTNN